jgi:hypothetical protein
VQHTSPATRTNSFFLLATVYTGTPESRALISSGLNAKSHTGWGLDSAAAAAAIEIDCKVDMKRMIS